MTQYINKAVLVAEIEKRIKGLNACHADRVAGYAGEISGLERLLSFLDTLEVKEEHVNEDLEEAVENYAATGEMLPNGKVMINFQAEKAFRTGAKWQEEHLIGKMEQFLYEELSNGDIECRDMKFLIEYFKFYMKK